MEHITAVAEPIPWEPVVLAVLAATILSLIKEYERWWPL
jgi:hypothetical protein